MKHRPCASNRLQFPWEWTLRIGRMGQSWSWLHWLPRSCSGTHCMAWSHVSKADWYHRDGVQTLHYHGFPWRACKDVHADPLQNQTANWCCTFHDISADIRQLRSHFVAGHSCKAPAKTGIVPGCHIISLFPKPQLA